MDTLQQIMSWKIIRRIEDFEEPADDSIVIIIDVLRFSTTAITLFDYGAKYIRPVTSESGAIDFKNSNPGSVLVGEDNGIKLNRFDYNNSPTEIQNGNVCGKPVGVLTTNGTRAIKKVQEFQSGDKDIDILIGGTINAVTVAQSITKQDRDVYLLAAGKDGHETKDDIVGAKIIRDYRDNNNLANNQLKNYKQEIESSRSAENLRDIGYKKDVEFCLNFNSSETIPKLENQRLVNNG
jgi:Phosphosulfolactate phosphohydrolase and related enzymes